MKKLLAVFGLCLILFVQSSLQIGKEKVPPFRPPKDAKIDEMFGNKIIEKRGVGFGKTKIPPFVPDEGVKINGHLGKHLEKRDAPSAADELPLLLKTLRLRPGSGDNINEIIENYIKAHKGQDSQGPVEGGKPAGDDEPRLLGEPLIGSNRHPPVKEDEKPNTHDGGILNSIKKIGRGWGRFFGGKKPVENSNPEGDEPRLLGEPMIGSNRHPPVKDGEKPADGGRPKRSADADDSVAEPELPGKNMIGKNRHPSGKSHPDEERPKRSVVDELKPVEEEMDLPALLKTLRLRPGSNEYNKIVDDFIKNRKGDGVSGGNVKDEPKHEDNGDVDVDDGPIGRKLISAFHLPPFRPSKDHNKPVIECKDEDREQVLQCFTEYFKNFDLEVVDGKLPSMFEIYGKMKKCKDYEKQQKYFQDFAACYKSTPETCFHSAELSKITQQPEEADYLATFFTISEFSFKSKHNKKVAKCFIGKVVEASKHKYTNFKECETVKEILLEAIANFKVDCAKTEPQDGDLKSLLQPFLRRTSLGSNCPSLLSDINV